MKNSTFSVSLFVHKNGKIVLLYNQFCQKLKPLVLQSQILCSPLPGFDIIL